MRLERVDFPGAADRMEQVVHQQSILSELKGIQLAASEITAASHKERNPVFVQRDEGGLSSLSAPAREFSSMLGLAPTPHPACQQTQKHSLSAVMQCVCACRSGLYDQPLGIDL